MSLGWFVFGALVLAVLAGVLRARRDGRSSPPEQPRLLPTIRGPGKYAMEVVGESFYAPAFESLLGKLAHDDSDGETLTQAELHLDANNPHDANAVRVEILGRTVGHLSRADARDFREAIQRDGLEQYRVFQVAARVYHGGPEKLFSVSVDLPLA